MATYVMLTSLRTDAIHNPKDYSILNRAVEDVVKRQCPDIKWIANYSVLGPYDYLDIFEAPDTESATKVALLFRTIGHAKTEVWPAVAREKLEEIANQTAA